MFFFQGTPNIFVPRDSVSMFLNVYVIIYLPKKQSQKKYANGCFCFFVAIILINFPCTCLTDMASEIR